jgi:hypothetical protein
MKYSLERIREEAGDRRVVIFTIPRRNDFQRYGELKLSPLGAELSLFAQKNHIDYIDLLPLMFKQHNLWELFLGCDGHWSPKGNYEAEKILLEKFK